MKAPLIGVTTSVTVGKTPERAYVNSAYLNAVQQAGGVPVLFPPGMSEAAFETLWPRLDGLLLTGGGDIDPARFDAPRGPTVTDVSIARDGMELDLLYRALGQKVPTLAICRGIQVLNVMLGGTLHQDIRSDLDTTINHTQEEPRHHPTHAVKVQGEGTRLGRIVGALELEVNSFHHQAIKRLARGLREVAWAPDGIIEGVEMPDVPFVVGVQWHPEDLVGHDRAARMLFHALIEAATR